MKRSLSFIYLLFLIIQACNNVSKDSVDIADSINDSNKEKADSAGLYSADAETTDFLVNASNGAMAEIKLGELAVNKSSSAQVKAIAQMMINEHTASNNEIKALAAARKISMPESIAKAEEKALNEMMSRKGADFDNAFVRYMINDHERDITLFKRAIDKVNDSEVRTFANNTLPKLQQHLDSFKMIQTRIE